MPGSTKGGIAVRGELLHRLIGASVLHSEDGGPQAMHRSAAQARSGVDEARSAHERTTLQDVPGHGNIDRRACCVVPPAVLGTRK